MLFILAQIPRRPSYYRAYGLQSCWRNRALSDQRLDYLVKKSEESRYIFYCVFPDSDFKKMKILTKQIIYKTYLEKSKKKLQNIRVDTNIVNTCIFTNIFRLEKLQHSRAQDLQILRIYIEESAETSVEINDTLMVYS